MFLTFKEKSDSLFVIYTKNYAFSKKKVSQSDARFKSYLNLKKIQNRLKCDVWFNFLVYHPPYGQFTQWCPDSEDITKWWPHSEAITYCVKSPRWELHTIGDGLTVRPSPGDVPTVGTVVRRGGGKRENWISHYSPILFWRFFKFE